MKIVFIIGSVSDSHIIKRAVSFKENGYDVEVHGFHRGVNTVNNFGGLPLHLMGEMKDQNYLSRIKTEWRVVRKVVNSYPKNTLFYVWGFDLALICRIKGCRCIYEISDMVHSKFPSPLRQIFKMIDKWMIKKSIFTLTTSEGFIEYLGLEGYSKLVLMPNKLSDVFLERNRPDLCSLNDKVRFGFVGYYRYPNTVLRLARVIGEKYPKMEFHFWGTGPEKVLSNVKAMATKLDNVFEHGPFKNPDDLQKVYSSFDIVACNYDAQGANERIAEPNKLYESIFFNKPILVSENTFLGKKVRRMGVGYVAETSSDDYIIAFLDGLTRDDVISKSKKESLIPASELVEDYTEVWNRLNNV